jgi:peptidoglycan/LPS O-acetylase OafA/YrhL
MYWPALDGLRGIAVAAVLLYHFGAPVGTGGYLGVDLFFVISGCLITTSLQQSLARGERASAFFIRRAARLLPNLLLLLVAVTGWNAWHDGGLLTRHGEAALLGLAQGANLMLVGDGQGTAHLWSLSEEWQFYAVLPFLLPAICARGLHNGVRWALALAAASITARPVLELLFDATLAHVYLWPITRLDDLMLGVAVALLVQQGRAPSSRVLPVMAGVGVMAALLVAPHWYANPEWSLFAIMPAVGVSAFVVVWSLVSSPPNAWLSRVLAARPLRYLGARSYSVYLWHYFVGVAVIAHGETWHGPSVFLRQMAGSMLVAAAAYEWLERPARTWIRRWQSGEPKVGSNTPAELPAWIPPASAFRDQS